MNYQTALEQIKGYQPHFEDYNYIDLLNINSTLQIGNNYIYYGQLHKNIKQGRGILQSLNGRKYEGYWKNDLKDGYGWEQLPNGSEYEGYYFQGKPHGKGKFIWANGEQYVGQWNMGIKEGKGIWYGLNGEYYQGQWKANQAQGFGEYVQNGNKYIGNFLNWIKNGEGEEFFKNGDRYQGNYVNGLPHGYGEYFWVNGAQFQGYFKEGLRCGKGIWKRSNKLPTDFYQGDYQEDRKNGYGIYKWANGNQYKGQFVNDYKHGYGEMIYFDGQIVKGNWQKGKIINQLTTQPMIQDDNNQYNIKIIDETIQLPINTIQNKIILKIPDVEQSSNQQTKYLNPNIFDDKNYLISSNPPSSQTHRKTKTLSIKQYTKEREFSKSQECPKAFLSIPQIDMANKIKIQSKFLIKQTLNQNFHIKQSKLSNL
ncbi:unnamed protein product [Paramecium sonneborni]|uniref:MORN repeat protein n=1 Tax=Paramecium sonneborni TaxID=65129 RepID=A0A8S1MLS9_9CILI|nr:unnamed protein product [Paramecium sonneborni]